MSEGNVMNLYKTEESARKRLETCVRIDSLTPRQARIEVAKDVLAAIKLRRITAATEAIYVRLHIDRVEVGVDLRSQLPKMEGPATVCGIGALMLAHVARFNQYHIRSWALTSVGVVDLDRWEIKCQLRNVFSMYELEKNELEKIEAVYEGWVVDFKSIGLILQRYPGKDEAGKVARLQAIMLDIIKHGNLNLKRLASPKLTASSSRAALPRGTRHPGTHAVELPAKPRRKPRRSAGITRSVHRS